VQVIAHATEFTSPGTESRHWVEHLSVPDLSVGTYSIPVDGADDQSPHTEDEIYVVISGRAVLTADSGSAAVGPGSVLFVPAGEGHRFTDITEDLTVLVVFGPAEGSRSLDRG